MMRMDMNPTRFGTPGMGSETEAAYGSVYGDSGADFIRVLQDSPYEIAVLSRLIAYLAQKWKGEC